MEKAFAARRTQTLHAGCEILVDGCIQKQISVLFNTTARRKTGGEPRSTYIWPERAACAWLPR